MDVVVSVDEDGGAARLVLVFGDDDGVAGGWVNRWRQAASGQLVGDELGAALHVGLVIGLGGDAGDAEEGFKAFEGLASGGVDVLEDGGEHGSKFRRMGRGVKGRRPNRLAGRHFRSDRKQVVK